MKYLLGTLASVFALTSIGQITITSADLPSSGDTVIISTTNSIGAIDPAETGADYSWDYSSLVATDQSIERFVTIGGTPIAYQFAFNNGFLYPDHQANVAQNAPDQDMAGMLSLTEVYNYFDNASDAYRQTGFGANFNGAPLPIRYDTIETVYELPLDFNDAFQSKLAWEASIPSLGFFSQHKVIENEVEGWGTLILPNGSYPVLKIKKTIQENDSVYVDQFGFGSQIPVPEAIEYHFLGTESIVPLLKITLTGGNVSEVKYRDDFDAALSLSEFDNSLFRVYPNPTSSALTISNSEELQSIRIIDLKGSVNNVEVNQVVDVSFLSPGVYIIQVESKNGKVYAEKLIIK